MPRRRSNTALDSRAARAVVRELQTIGRARLRDNAAECAPTAFYRALLRDYFEALFRRVAAACGRRWRDDAADCDDLEAVCTAFLSGIDFGDYSPALSLGALYQYLLACEPSIEGEGRSRHFLLTRIRRNARKSSGSYYTPDLLISRLLDATLEPMLEIASTALDPIDALLSIRVCDPACGSGLFLIAATRRIVRRLNAVGYSGDPKPSVIRQCVYGVDIDDIAARLSRFSLWFEAGGAFDADCVPVGNFDALVPAAREPQSGDSVGPPSLDWLGAGFDVVIGNPPWLSMSGRQRVSLAGETLRHLELRYPEMREWPALHSAFLLLALRSVRAGGRVGLVLPLPVAYLDGYAAVRAAVERQGGIVTVIDAGETAFYGVTQAAGLFSIQFDPKQRVESAGSAWRIESHRSAVIVRESAPDISRLMGLPTVAPRVFSDPGVHTGNMSRLLLVDQPGVELGQYRPVREGRDITAYRCGPPRRYLDTSPVISPGSYCRIGPLDRYQGVPIILRQTSDRPVAARHVDPTYFRNSVLACAGLPGVPHEVTLAILNSDMISRWYRSQFGDASQLRFPQIKIRNLQKLPMFDPVDLVDTVDTIVGLVRGLESSTDSGCREDLREKLEIAVRKLYRVDMD